MALTVPTAPVRKLRPGQHAALQKWAEALRAGVRCELVVVPVGYGKTIIGVGSFEVAAGVLGTDTCLYLAPTDVLRTQVYNAVERALEVVGGARPLRKIMAENATFERTIGSAANLIVASYQQVAAAPGLYERLCRERRVHLVCDEAHHLGERGQWAAALGGLKTRSTLLLSATPVRLDREPIAGARYIPAEDGGSTIAPLLEVSMRQAWREGGILKHLNIQMKDYRVQLRNDAGDIQEFSASEMAELPDFDQRCVRQQLRWNEDYVQPLVREFALTLGAKNAAGPRQHQGLVFAATTEHANHLQRVFAGFHPDLRTTVVHSGEIAEAENVRRLATFHAGGSDVLIQVRKASEGFDAPAVSVLLKLDAVFSREPVIQQLGRGLRYNHALPKSQNLLNVFVGRDPRLGAIIEHLERDAPPIVLKRSADDLAYEIVDDDGEAEDVADGERAAAEIVDVAEAGDAYLDHTGRFVEGQQLTMFGVTSPAPSGVGAPAPEVIDLAGQLKEAIEYCRNWTNRAAKQRAVRFGGRENHHAALNLAFSRDTGQAGSLSTADQYRAKGDWMKRRYSDLLG